MNAGAYCMDRIDKPPVLVFDSPSSPSLSSMWTKAFCKMHCWCPSSRIRTQGLVYRFNELKEVLSIAYEEQPIHPKQIETGQSPRLESLVVLTEQNSLAMAEIDAQHIIGAQHHQIICDDLSIVSLVATAFPRLLLDSADESKVRQLCAATIIGSVLSFFHDIDISRGLFCQILCHVLYAVDWACIKFWRDMKSQCS